MGSGQPSSENWCLRWILDIPCWGCWISASGSGSAPPPFSRACLRLRLRRGRPETLRTPGHLGRRRRRAIARCGHCFRLLTVVPESTEGQDRTPFPPAATQRRGGPRVCEPLVGSGGLLLLVRRPWLSADRSFSSLTGMLSASPSTALRCSRHSSLFARKRSVPGRRRRRASVRCGKRRASGCAA